MAIYALIEPVIELHTYVQQLNQCGGCQTVQNGKLVPFLIAFIPHWFS